ncbi:TPA: Eaa protein, partial [Enterobacter kobei]|nr:Eaa protein [Enterobacter kobei]
MSTITKQWLQQKIADMEATRDEIPFGLDEDDSNTLAAMKLALASLEAEAVGYMNRFTGRVFTLEEQPGADTDAQVYVPVYAAPPAPVSVPDAMEMDDDFDSAFEHGKAVGWNACRA